ncbi:ferredoxin [Nocardiopsis coralliicola]
MHITADTSVCVSAGLCVLTAPGVFDQGDDGLVAVLLPDPPAQLRTAAGRAVRLCPSGALGIGGATRPPERP